jgi:hypothetical protein
VPLWARFHVATIAIVARRGFNNVLKFEIRYLFIRLFEALLSWGPFVMMLLIIIQMLAVLCQMLFAGDALESL